MAHLFNGTNDSLEVGSAPATGVPLTLSCWFNASTDVAGVLMSIGVGGGFDRFQIFTGGTIGINAAATAAKSPSLTGQSVSSGTPALNTWHHVAGVFTSSTERVVYFNGVPGVVNTDLVTPSGLNRLNIGARYNTTLGAYFTGMLAEAAVYNAALTAAEIISLSKRYRPDRIRPQNLVYFDRLIRTPQDLRGGRLITQLGTGTTPFPHPAILFP